MSSNNRAIAQLEKERQTLVSYLRRMEALQQRQDVLESIEADLAGIDGQLEALRNIQSFEPSPMERTLAF